jgi:hypothetical protein
MAAIPIFSVMAKMPSAIGTLSAIAVKAES